VLSRDVVVLDGGGAGCPSQLVILEDFMYMIKDSVSKRLFLGTISDALGYIMIVIARRRSDGCQHSEKMVPQFIRQLSSAPGFGVYHQSPLVTVPPDSAGNPGSSLLSSGVTQTLGTLFCVVSPQWILRGLGSSMRWSWIFRHSTIKARLNADRYK
jgi:hypothetical protein